MIKMEPKLASEIVVFWKKSIFGKNLIFEAKPMMRGAKKAPTVYMKWKDCTNGLDFTGPQTSSKMDWIPESIKPPNIPGIKI